MVRLPKAILFDLDDTLLSLGGREALLVEVAEEFGGALAPLTPAEVSLAVEAAFLDFWAAPDRYATWRTRILEARIGVVQRLFEGWRSRAPGLTPEVAARFAERFHHLRENGEGRLFAGAVETVRELRRRGVRLALVTNGYADTQREKVERFGLAPLFDHVQIEGEHGFGKPEERAYHFAMDSLGVKPHETWMVGDNLVWEVAAPQRLGIYAVWHDHLGKGLPPGSEIVPDRIVRRVSELLDEPELSS